MRIAKLLISCLLVPACVMDEAKGPETSTVEEHLDLGDACIWWQVNPNFWAIVGAAASAKGAGLFHDFTDCVNKVKDGYSLNPMQAPLGETGASCACKQLYDTVQPPAVAHIWSDDTGHIEYVVKRTGLGDHFNIQFGIVDSGSLGQMESPSGIFEIPLPNTPPAPAGSLWTFQAEDCQDGIFGDTCNNTWNSPSIAYVPAHGTKWLEDTAPADQLAAAYSGGSELKQRIISNITTNTDFKICTVHFNGGQHVGKWYGGYCHIGWGGQEQTLRSALVLNTVAPGTGWTWTYGNSLPAGALAGGFEYGNSQYICRAWIDANGGGSFTSYHSTGYHPGKVVGDGCNVAFDGQERHITGWYQVLTN